MIGGSGCLEKLHSALSHFTALLLALTKSASEQVIFWVWRLMDPSAPKLKDFSQSCLHIHNTVLPILYHQITMPYEGYSEHSSSHTFVGIRHFSRHMGFSLAEILVLFACRTGTYSWFSASAALQWQPCYLAPIYYTSLISNMYLVPALTSVWFWCVRHVNGAFQGYVQSNAYGLVCCCISVIWKLIKIEALASLSAACIYMDAVAWNVLGEKKIIGNIFYAVFRPAEGQGSFLSC